MNNTGEGVAYAAGSIENAWSMPRSACEKMWQCANEGPSKSAARKRTVTLPGVGSVIVSRQSPTL